MYQLCGSAWEAAFGSLGPADSCVPSGSWNAGGRPVWPLNPHSLGQTQVALVGPRAGRWGASGGPAQIPEGVWDDWKMRSFRGELLRRPPGPAQPVTCWGALGTSFDLSEPSFSYL